MVWLDGGSSPPISTVYTGSRQTSRSRPCRLCKQRHGLRGTSDDVFLQTAGNNAGFLQRGIIKFLQNSIHAYLPQKHL